MRRSPVPTVGLALGVALLVDVLRVWLPSIITIFGQAAATPAELLAAFALSWFLVAFAAPPLVRFAGPAPVTLAAAVVLAGCRLALPVTGGGSAQLYTASLGLLAGLVWLAATAATTVQPVPGLVWGLAAATAVHTALGTYDLVWRPDTWAWAVTVLAALAFVATGQPLTPWPVVFSRRGSLSGAGSPGAALSGAASAEAVPPGGARSWLLFGPALLLSGMVSGSPALLRTGISYGSGVTWLSGDDRVAGGIAQPGSSDAILGVLLGTAALTAFVAGGLLTTRRLWHWAGATLLIAGTVLFAAAGPGGPLPALGLTSVVGLGSAILATATGLGICLGMTDRSIEDTTTAAAAPAGSAGRRGIAAVAGMAIFAVAAVAYYAAYDLGYPNNWVPVAVAILAVAVALRAGPADNPRGPDHPAVHRPSVHRPSAHRSVAGRSTRRRLVVAAALTAILAGIVAPRTAPPAPVEPDRPVRLVAYNIRMGFGLDGRFDLERLAGVIARQDPDVVALSEVDRAWLLNGGHDTLALLARRLGMSYVFAPAADPVWGDAVLTRMAVRGARTVALPAVGAPTGAQALAVVLDAGRWDLVVVATHLQPPPEGGPVVQAAATARFAITFAAGRPLVVAGDLNTEPGEPAFEELRSAGLADALAAARPLPTSPADEPAQEIDHVLVSPGVTATDAVAPRSIASDHLPVAVTLTLPVH